MSKTEDHDYGYSRIVDFLREVDGAELVVQTGIRGEKAARIYKSVGAPNQRKSIPASSGLTLVEIATVNEFGTEDGRVPERPAFRQAFDMNEAKYGAYLENQLLNIIENGGDLRHMLARLGEVHVGDIQQRIRDLKEPPNSAATIARKGSSNPLIDTGRLRQSVDYIVKAIKGRLP